ncbi:hypothetical protein AVEN_179816-1 [Araneus ventricosus]|uniref:Uncharacterized protein n=1 Tax=Araneus ventricosus TaxID=182803 RepID=A0A4Y2FDV4_ARAVE|nr:hypothetical protein AVEN_179816-1 [Araneus ventricosus]
MPDLSNRVSLFAPQVNINRASFNSKINQFIRGYGAFLTFLYRFGLCSHDRCVCGDEGDPNHYATDRPVTKPFHFMKSNAENILDVVLKQKDQNKRSLLNIVKILHERRHDIIIDQERLFSLPPAF